MKTILAAAALLLASIQMSHAISRVTETELNARGETTTVTVSAQLSIESIDIAGTAGRPALWIFAKVKDAAGHWSHLHLDGLSLSTAADVEVEADGSGAIVTLPAGTDIVETMKATLTGRSDNAAVEARVFAFDMRLIESGPFWIGDGEDDPWGQFHDLSKEGHPPAFVEDESAILLGGAKGSLLSLGNRDGAQQWEANSDDFTNSHVPIRHPRYLPACYPKGTEAFYLMTFEVTQGQYVDFLNTLSYRQQATLVYAAPDSSRGTFVMGDADYPQDGHIGNGIVISEPGSVDDHPALFALDLDEDGVFGEAEDGADTAMNWMQWQDMAAFMDWAAMRPMTEFEFEKAARGSDKPTSRQNAWNGPIAFLAKGAGSDAALQLAANFLEISDRPLKVGMNIRKGRNRQQTGVSFFGVADLSGSINERTISIGRAEGRAFDGAHGDGELGPDGFADVATWPGFDGAFNTGKQGQGQRGGSFQYPEHLVAISNRYLATDPGGRRLPIFGFRAARSPASSMESEQSRCADAPLWEAGAAHVDIGSDLPRYSGGPEGLLSITPLAGGVASIQFGAAASEQEEIQVRWLPSLPEGGNLLVDIEADVSFVGDGYASLLAYQENPAGERKSYHLRASRLIDQARGRATLSAEIQTAKEGGPLSIAFNMKKRPDEAGASHLDIHSISVTARREQSAAPTTHY